MFLQPKARLRPAEASPLITFSTPPGDLSQAATDQQNVAVWNVQRADGLSYRLTAKGADGRATSVSMVANGAEVD